MEISDFHKKSSRVEWFKHSPLGAMTIYMATIGGSLWHKYKMYAFLLVRAATTSLQFVL